MSYGETEMRGRRSEYVFPSSEPSLYSDALFFKLGQWTHPCQMAADSDSILSDPQAVPFSEEIDAILSPHTTIISDLIHQNDTLWENSSTASLPIARYIQKNRKAATEAQRQGMVFLAGDLSLNEQAQISNWIYNKVEDAKTTVHLWVGGAALAHAFTVVIAHQKCADISKLAEYRSAKSPKERKQFMLDTAWKYQQSTLQHDQSSALAVDVDKECLDYFESRLFERSLESGIARFYQWGLDAGYHQGKWDPWAGLPNDWYVGDLEVDEEEWNTVSTK